MQSVNPLPRSPFVKGQQEEIDSSEIYRGWPPRGTGSSRRPHDFLSQKQGGGLKVVWPPNWATDDDTEGDGEGLQDRDTGNRSSASNQNAGGPNMTMTYPSAFKLRDEAPIDHQTLPLTSVPSQPAFKITQPMRKSGDEVWPPKGAFKDVPTTEVRDFIRPEKHNRNYDEFFATNSLPNNYPGYKAPPGTQHVGEMEEAHPL